jgi:hypothetical protein
MTELETAEDRMMEAVARLQSFGPDLVAIVAAGQLEAARAAAEDAKVALDELDRLRSAAGIDRLRS